MEFGVASLRPRKQSSEFYSRLETASIHMENKGKDVLPGPQVLVVSVIVHFASTNYSFFLPPLFLPNNDNNIKKD